MTADLARRLAASQDSNADLELLRNAIAVESITGNESGFARFLKREMEKIGFETATGEFRDGRENVWGWNSGHDCRPHLVFVGHTDTVHVRGWSEYWQGDPRSDPFSATEIDGELWGRGACDLKGGICAAIAAIRLLGDVGLDLAGRITFAFVGDEESGECGTGVSAGAKDLVRRIKSGHVPVPDFAVYVEPTRLDVYTAQIGFFIAEITVTGRSAYFGRPELGVDALRFAHALLKQLWDHDAQLAAGPSHDLVGKSALLVTGMNCGGYIAVPGKCRISLIRKLRPGEKLDDAVDEFESSVASTRRMDGISISIDYPAGRDHPKGGSPVEIPTDSVPALLLQESIQQISNKDCRIGGAPYWSETPFLVNELQCPSVYCAPGDISVAHTFEERIGIEEYLAAVRGFSLFAARFCGVDQPSQDIGKRRKLCVS